MIEFDPKKEAASRHGLPFALAAQIFDGRYVETIDDRFDYGETRIVAVGLVASLGFLCTTVYTWRGSTRRIISLRRSGYRDRKIYHDRDTRGG